MYRFVIDLFSYICWKKHNKEARFLISYTKFVLITDEHSFANWVPSTLISYIHDFMHSFMYSGWHISFCLACYYCIFLPLQMVFLETVMLIVVQYVTLWCAGKLTYCTFRCLEYLFVLKVWKMKFVMVYKSNNVIEIRKHLANVTLLIVNNWMVFTNKAFNHGTNVCKFQI